MKKSTLILDLDHTIFQTSTIDKKAVEPFFNHLLTNLTPLFPKKIIENIADDLWKVSWDVVIDRYDIPKEIFAKSVTALESTPFTLEITAYPDYQFLKDYAASKFLVTTGLTSLQQAKIKALNIENDFIKIIINDRLIETRTKRDIFRELMTQYDLDPQKTYVVGDNPQAEIQAGNDLNLITIQILRDDVIKGHNAKYYIHSFEELQDIIAE